MKKWTMIAGTLSAVMSIQAVACTQPTSEATGEAEAPLTASVRVNGQLVGVPVVNAAVIERGAAQIKAQSEAGSASTWAELQDGRRVVVLDQRQDGNRISARGYIEDAAGLRTPFELNNISPSQDPSTASALQPRFWGILVILVIIVVVVIIVAPPIWNAYQCSERSTDGCLCQKGIPEPTACTVGGSMTDSGKGVEACAKVDAPTTACVCRPRDPASTVECGKLSDPPRLPATDGG